MFYLYICVLYSKLLFLITCTFFWVGSYAHHFIDFTSFGYQERSQEPGLEASFSPIARLAQDTGLSSHPRNNQVAGADQGFGTRSYNNSNAGPIVVNGLLEPTEICATKNTAFKSGEVVTFKIFYSVIGLHVDAGTASFSVNDARLNNKPVFHITGLGSSNPSYDWIFRVRDRYESFIDTATLKPYTFIRHVEEGKFRKDELVKFNHIERKAVSTKGTYPINPCMQDVLSAIYFARNIDFSKYKVGDKIPLSMFLDDASHDIYIRYLGKETIKTRYGKFKAIKFRPLLISGTIFSGGELMSVWVSDDNNRLPLRIESPITVGSVKVDMMGYRNLRYPLQSLIGFN